MILKKLILENTGPINNINHSFASKDNVIKPLVLVGRNGSGKSIAISFIVNSIIAGKQVLFDDVEVEKGKVYKLRSPNYIRNGHDFYYGKIEMSDNFYCTEFQLVIRRKEFEDKLKYTPLHRDWNSIPNEENSFFDSNFNSNTQKLREIYVKNSLLYFPPNRFEEPAWVNHYSLTKAEFSEEPKLRNLSNRQIICDSTLSKTKNWLLDVIFDSRVLEKKNLKLKIL